MGVSKFSKLGLPQLWGPITLFVNLRLRWGLKQICNPCRELFNGMWHVTCTKGNWVNSWLLVVGSQTANLTLSFSFGHNLCFKCSNESFELILDIFVSIVFRWYKELFNPMGFDFCNRYLKIRESIGTPTSKVRIHLGVWGFILSHSPTHPGV
jgi:hypothetical protein